MSRRARSNDRGFTLLECEVALVVLTLALMFLSRLTVAHETLVADVEAWVDGDPTFYVDLRDARWERLLGHPPELAAGVPEPPPAPPAADYEVELVSLSHDLAAPSVTVVADVEEVTP